MRIRRSDARDAVSVTREDAQALDTFRFEIVERHGERKVRKKKPTRYGEGRPEEVVDRGICYALVLRFKQRIRLVYDGRPVPVDQTVPEPVENELYNAGAEEIQYE